MYVKAYVTLCRILPDMGGSEEEEYEVGAEVEPTYMHDGRSDRHTGYEVGEPDLSAPGCELESSRIAHDPQAGGVLCDGWSERVEEALVASYQSLCEDGPDNGLDPDEYDDIYADRDDGDYMCGED